MKDRRIFKRVTIQTALTVFLICIFTGCKSEDDQPKKYHAEKLKIDHRYSKVIDFEPLSIVIPFEGNKFIRIDGSVENVSVHQQMILKELLPEPQENFRFHYSNEAAGGRTMTLNFKDGKTCCFIWILQNDNAIISTATLNHEKYHALCRLAPESIAQLNNGIQKTGFSVRLQDYNEELAATIIQILSINLDGVDLKEISGSELVIQAVEILKNAQISKK